MAPHWTKAYPHVDVKLAPRNLVVEERPGGVVILKNGTPLAPYPRHTGVVLRERAEKHPDRTFLAERDEAGAWRRLSYAAAREAADRVAQWLLDDGHTKDRPVAVLCDNSVNFGILTLGCQQAGVPIMPISPAYSLMSTDHAKIKYLFEKFDPSLVYVDRLGPFAKALAAGGTDGRRIVADRASGEIDGAVAFADLLKTTPGRAAAEAFAQVDGDTIAKILLTSGSTGMPKGVLNPQRMLWASMVSVQQLWPFLSERPPVLVDWLPWNHTFGSNWNFNQILFNGGTLYIDAGKPLPGKIETTLKNLREIRPTLLYNVPRAYDMLIPVWEADEEFARHVFGDLDCIFYAGAGLTQNAWDRLEGLCIKARGKRVPMFTSLGSTETSPPATVCHWPSDFTGSVGLPKPGLEAKLVPSGDKIEIRLRGPDITPGYYKDPEKTREAFDEEGFYRIGDAVKLMEPGNYQAGLMFDGRVAENFKLGSGTWVATGTLRLNVLSATQPLIQDAAVTGHDREEIGLLAFPNFAGCKQAIGTQGDNLAPEQIVRHPKLHGSLKEKLAAYNKANPGSSTQVRRVLLMTEPPNIDAGEITDKGYLNQRAILARRAELVQRLYSASPGDDVVTVGKA